MDWRIRAGHVYILCRLQDLLPFFAKYWPNIADLVHHETKRLIFQIIEIKRPERRMVLPKSSKQTKIQSVTEQFHFDAKLWKHCCQAVAKLAILATRVSNSIEGGADLIPPLRVVYRDQFSRRPCGATIIAASVLHWVTWWQIPAVTAMKLSAIDKLLPTFSSMPHSTSGTTSATIRRRVPSTKSLKHYWLADKALQCTMCSL